MTEFLTTHATAYYIESIIMNAKRELTLVSPYLQLSKTFFGRMKEADTRGVKTTLIFGKNQLKPEEKIQLSSLKNLSLYFCKDLHAKCYYNEDSMVITSMNMYEFSEKNNREMGILIKSQDDSTVFKAAIAEVESIIQSPDTQDSSFRQIPASHRKANLSVKHKSKDEGKTGIINFLENVLGSAFNNESLAAYCIRCGDKISSDPDHPLCDTCYREWAEYNNPSYKENFCHSCGKRMKTSKAKPLCSQCYRKYF